MNLTWLIRLLEKVPPAARPAVIGAGNIVLGVLLAIVLHYVCYRIGLPSKPFIYVAF
jgi:hypothetical protein